MDPIKSLYYVYAVTHQCSDMRHPEIGIDNMHPLECIRYNQLFALVSKVAWEEFNQEKLSLKMKDANWLENSVRQHTAIVNAIDSSSGIIPMRFLTLCKGLEDIKNFLQLHESQLEKGLRSVQGAKEWGIKVFCNSKKLEQRLMILETQPHLAEPKIPESSQGRAFLVYKKKKRKVKENLAKVCEEFRNECHSRLAVLARQAQLIPLQAKEYAGRPESMIFNSAYLVNDEDWEHFKEMVDWLSLHYKDHGFDIVHSGPWPPYHFIKQLH